MRALALCLLASCAVPPEPVLPPPEAPFWRDQDVEVRVEVLAAGGTDQLGLQGGRRLVVQDGGLSLHDPRRASEVYLTNARTELRGGAWLADDSILIATDRGLTHWDGGELRESPLAERITGELRAIRDAGQAPWILDDAGWHYTTDTSWSTPQVEGGATDEGLVVTGPGRAWLQQGDVLALLVRSEAGWSLEEHWEIPGLRDFEVDGDGGVWATEGLDLHRRTGPLAWEVEVLPAPVAQLAAHPDAPGIWVQTTEGSFHGDSSGVSPVELPQGWWLGADSLGGLVVRTETDLVAARVTPGVQLLDVPEGSVDGIGDIEITAQVRPLEGIEGLELTVAGEAVSISQSPPFQARIDTTGLARGRNALALTVRWQDGQTHAIESALRSDAGVVTWRQHVQPIFQDRCQVCHGGSADTVLETASDWQENLALILEQVEQARMPLGDEPLPDEEIELIRAWRDGGFP